MDHIFGKPKPKVDTGLDSEHHNYYKANERLKKREKELKERMSNPLTYPSRGESLRDQRRAVPTAETTAKLGLEDRKRYMGNIELENMIMDNLSKYGLLVSGNVNATENAALFREALRPSLITQHINFQSRKIWKKDREAKKKGL